MFRVFGKNKTFFSESKTFFHLQEHEKETGVDRNMLKIPVHIDHRNPTRFEVEDLKKLIIKVSDCMYW